MAGVLIKITATKKNAECTMMTTGVVVKHGFAGDGRFYPVVDFTVNGETYTTRKKFNGIISVRQTGLPIPYNNDASINSSIFVIGCNHKDRQWEDSFCDIKFCSHKNNLALYFV